MSDFYPIVKLAKFSAAIGDKDGYQSAVDECEHQLTDQINHQATDPSQTARDAKAKAGDYLYIAAARARAGDLAGVQRDIDASRRTATLDAYDWDDGWSMVVGSYADAGLFAQATAAAADAKVDTYGLFPAYIARREFESNHVDDAWKLAAKVPLIERMKLEYVFAVRQAQAGTDITNRLQSLNSPYEKALVELATAQALLGNPFHGSFRGWQRGF